MTATRPANVLAALALLALGTTIAAGVARADTASPTSENLASDLTYMVEEERVAHDLYQVLADAHDGARPFSNIVRSEQRHVEAVRALLTAHGITDPTVGREAGSYANTDLQALYDASKTKGTSSWTAAVQIGIAVEKQDIADLEKSLDRTQDAEVRRVYENLLAASRQHLDAFTRAASNGQGAGSGQGVGSGQGAGSGQGVGNGQVAGKGRGTGDGECDGTGRALPKA
jgi:hypothetical protein